MKILWTAVFGLAGVFSRFAVDQSLSRFTLPVPFGTLGINVLGSFLAGMLFVFGSELGRIPPDLQIGLMIGFLGGFTTFSSYSLQSARLIETGAIGSALLYWAISPVLGIAASLGGLALARGIFR